MAGGELCWPKMDNIGHKRQIGPLAETFTNSYNQLNYKSGRQMAGCVRHYELRSR